MIIKYDTSVCKNNSLNERKFKIAFLDVGLMQNALGVQDSIILDNSIMQINAGGVAEQYVAQELFACADPYSDKKLHFWAREARGSNAEVDFLIEIEGMVIPVEVKAGARGSFGWKYFSEEYKNCIYRLIKRRLKKNCLI